MKKNKKTKKIIFATLVIALLVIIGALSTITLVSTRKIKQEDILKKEIENYSNKDLSTDDFKITIKSNGDYAYVEETIKKYYKKLSNNIKKINYYISVNSIENIISVSNLSKDRPYYTLSYDSIKNIKDNINDAILNITNLCDENTIKELIDKKKLNNNDYYYDIYLSFMNTKNDKQKFINVKKQMNQLASLLNNYLDKIDNILTFLKENDKYITYENNMIYFSSDKLSNEYKKMVIDLNDTLNNVSNNDTTNEI